MKTRINTITILLLIGMITLTNVVKGQTMERGYYNYLTDTIKDKKPKPQSIKFKGNKVIVVWNRREWERAQWIGRKRVERIKSNKKPQY
jgi:hypothetical protein